MAKIRSKKQLIVAGASFAIALSTGFIMQYGGALAHRFAPEEQASAPQARLEPDAVIIPVAAITAVPTALGMPSATLPQFETAAYEYTFDEIKPPSIVMPSVNDIATTSADALMLDVIDSTLDREAEEALLAEVAEFCQPLMSATATDLAMVVLEISNSCRPDATVAIHHQGMMFDVITDDEGYAIVEVPALSTDAFFIAAYDDGEGAVASTEVPALALYDRAVLQWQGENTVGMHVFEFGAGYGDAGHIWSASTADPKMAVAGLGGFLTTLGNPAAENAMMAEVYTYPSGITLNEGGINLRVEAEVTSRNCGRRIEAQSIQWTPGTEATAVDLELTLPGCEAVGEFILLKNMFQDLTLASK